MAKATACCTCKHCGAKFEKTLSFCSRSNADAWLKTAADRYDECSDCYKARIASEQDSKIACLGLPQIIGVSDKQIAYATSIRRSFAYSKFDRMDIAQQIRDFNVDELKQCFDADGKDMPTDISEARRSLADRYDVKKEYKLCIISEASKIIDLLR